VQGDEVQKQVAEVAKSLYQRTDELAVLLARDHRPFVVVAADVRLSVPRHLPQIACTLSSVDVYSVWIGGCLQ
jgi:hypothetical protein